MRKIVSVLGFSVKTLHGELPLGPSTLPVVVVHLDEILANRTQKRVDRVGVVRWTQSGLVHRMNE